MLCKITKCASQQNMNLKNDALLSSRLKTTSLQKSHPLRAFLLQFVSSGSTFFSVDCCSNEEVVVLFFGCRACTFISRPFKAAARFTMSRAYGTVILKVIFGRTYRSHQYYELKVIFRTEVTRYSTTHKGHHVLPNFQRMS